MIERDDLYNRLLFLVPDAKFSFWKDEGLSDKGCENPIHIDGWVIDWRTENASPCPSLEDIQAVDAQALAAQIEENRKVARDAYYMNSFSMVANYQQAKLADANLTWRQYMDNLEAFKENM